MLAAIPIGLILGRLLGGQLDGLVALRFRWSALAVAGLVVQLALFTEAGHALAGGMAPAIYVLSTAAVLVAVLANFRVEWMPVVTLGAASNLAAIVANGGAMPTTIAALAAAGLEGPGTATNSVVLENPVLGALTDVYAIPAGIPLANVFSIGDVLIAIGIAAVIASAMRSAAPRAGSS